MIRQIDVTGRSVKEAMKLARRWSPRYIYVGEIRTPEIAEELLHMADAGPMVVTTIHATDAVSAVQSLYTYACQAMDEVMARGMIESTLKQVVSSSAGGEQQQLIAYRRNFNALATAGEQQQFIDSFFQHGFNEVKAA